MFMWTMFFKKSNLLHKLIMKQFIGNKENRNLIQLKHNFF